MKNLFGKLVLLIGLFTIAISCSNQHEPITTENKFSINDTFHLPIDTSAIINEMNLQLNFRADGIDTISNLDTFELRYLAFACDCQNWVDIKMHDAYLNNDEQTYGEDSIGYRNFNTDDYGYFLQEGKNVKSIEHLNYTPFSQIRFFGTVKDDPNYYTESKIPNRKQVITYYGYEVIFPFSFYGPYYYSDDSSNTDVERMILTINQ